MSFIIFIYFNIIYFYRKQNEIQRKLQTKKELEEYENELKKDLEEKKGIVDQEQLDLQKREEESAKELEDIKNMVESKKDNIIDFIIILSFLLSTIFFGAASFFVSFLASFLTSFFLSFLFPLPLLLL